MKANKINPIIAALTLCLMMASCGGVTENDTAQADTSSTAAVTTVQTVGDTEETETEETSQDIESAEPEETTSGSAESQEDKSEESSAGTAKSGKGRTSDNGTSDTAAQGSTDTQTSSGNTGSTKSSGEQSASETLNTGSEVVAAFTANTSGQIDTSDLFSNRDLTQTPDVSDAVYYTVSDGETVTITSAGVYVFSGTASDYQIRVEADGDNDKVQIVLNGVNVTNSDSPVIYVVSADKCFVTTVSGTENTLSVTGAFSADGDTNTDAVIFSKDDLVLNGLGTLNITSSYGNGISGHDDLKVTGGTYNITSALDAIEANDSIRICGGTFTIKSGKDGLHCENDDAEGYIYISDGIFDITASSDGIQAATVLQIDGGTVTVSASEGLEATYVQVNGGDITITASDDGINASQKSSYSTPTIEFNGGYTTINMGQGDTDGVDVNGTVYVNGGTVSVNTSGNSFDYDQGAYFNGGTILINGSEVSEIPEDMMGGMGGPGGMGGFGGDQGGFGGRGGRMV